MNTNDSGKLTQEVRVMQVITAALAIGVITFGVVLVVIAKEPEPDRQSFLALIGVFFAAMALIAGFVVPKIIANQGPPNVGGYQTSLIIGLAIFEGAAFFNLIAFFLEGQGYSLAMAGVLLLLILMHFPTVDRVQEWIERRERDAHERDAFGR